MIACYIQAAAEAPLRDRPNIRDAEIHYFAERDNRSLFSVALEQLGQRWAIERELAL